MDLPVNRYFIIHKPYNMVSQFVSPDNVVLLGSINFKFPEGIHAIGRLDKNSEGLLILTTNKKVTRLLFKGAIPHIRTYVVKLKHKLTEEGLLKLRSGVIIKIVNNEDYLAHVTSVNLIEDYEDQYQQVFKPEEFESNTWLRLTLTEGKFHQVRKMIVAIGNKCRRLVRISIEDLALEDLPAGGVREIEEKEFFEKLRIEI